MQPHSCRSARILISRMRTVTSLFGWRGRKPPSDLHVDLCAWAASDIADVANTGRELEAAAHNDSKAYSSRRRSNTIGTTNVCY